MDSKLNSKDVSGERRPLRRPSDGRRPKLYAAGADAKPGPNETVNVGLIGCGSRGGEIAGDLSGRPGRAHRGGLRSELAAHGRSPRAGRRRKGGRLPRFPQAAGRQAHRRGHRGHQRPLEGALRASTPARPARTCTSEKPLATSIGEGRAIVEAARKYKRIVQIGTQQHSSDHYRKAAEIVQSGRLGRIGEVKVWDYINQNPGIGAPPDADPPAELDWDFWLGPSPKVPYNPNRYEHHYWFFDYGGGWTTDWAVHHYDIVHWAMGARGPLAACGGGGHYCFDKDKDNREWPDTFSGTLEYGPCPAADKGFVLQYTARAGNQHDNYPASNGKCFYGTDATLLVHRGGCWLTPEIRASKKVEKRRGRSRTTTRPASTWPRSSRSVRSRTQPETDAEVGHRASIPGHLMNIAWRVGRKIRWNADAEQVLDDAEANALVTKKYRAPWKLEV